MKNAKIVFALVVLLFILTMLAGCACKHTDWKDATCISPKACAKCDLTEGEPLGHTWKSATCDTPKICSVCEEIDGEALGHKWNDATCKDPKTCSVCNKSEGTKTSVHTWKEATCKEPKTCSLCNVTEGDKTSAHKWSDADCENPQICSICKEITGSALGHNLSEATCEAPSECSICGKTVGTAKGHSYTKGYCSACNKKDPSVTLPSDIETIEQLVSYLNKNYSTVETPMGTISGISFKIDTLKYTDDYDMYPYDYYIKAETNLFLDGAGYRSIFGGEIKRIDISDDIKQGTVDALKAYQKEIADFAMEAFPDKKIAGGFYKFYSSSWESWGYSAAFSNRYFTWRNYSFTERGDLGRPTWGKYGNTILGSFVWDDRGDDWDGKF